MNELEWITNTVSTDAQDYRNRIFMPEDKHRAMIAAHVIGPPKATPGFSTELLANQGYIGLYKPATEQK